jgi:nitroreductase
LFDNAPAVATAPVLVVAFTEKITFGFGLDFEKEDYGAAVENVLLAAAALGYASVWLDGSTRLGGKDEAIRSLLDIAANKQVRALLPLGVPEAPGQQTARKAFTERVEWYR